MRKFPTHVTGLSKEDRIGVLLHEYNTLRQEMLERHTVLYQSIGFGAVIVAGLFTILIDRWWIALCGLFGAGILLMFGWRRVDLDTACIALRLCALEEEINTLASERLLVWESTWGVLSKNFDQRDQTVKQLRNERRLALGCKPSSLANARYELPLISVLTLAIVTILVFFMMRHLRKLNL